MVRGAISIDTKVWDHRAKISWKRCTAIRHMTRTGHVRVVVDGCSLARCIAVLVSPAIWGGLSGA